MDAAELFSRTLDVARIKEHAAWNLGDEQKNAEQVPQTTGSPQSPFLLSFSPSFPPFLSPSVTRKALQVARVRLLWTRLIV